MSCVDVWRLGVLVHTHNPSIKEADTRGGVVRALAPESSSPLPRGRCWPGIGMDWTEVLTLPKRVDRKGRVKSKWGQRKRWVTMSYLEIRDWRPQKLTPTSVDWLCVYSTKILGNSFKCCRNTWDKMKEFRTHISLSGNAGQNVIFCVLLPYSENKQAAFHTYQRGVNLGRRGRPQCRGNRH